jgi:acetoin utilization protein AcuC
MSEPRREAVFLYSERFRRRAYGRNHPLAIPRVALTLDVVRAYGAIESGELVEARLATDAELAGFHTSAYVAALRAAEARGHAAPEERARHALGTVENPYFDGLFSTPATAGGASVQAAEAVLAGRMAFNPAGGMHHAQPDRAQGFCFVNDVVLGIQALRSASQRVLYVDIDAHHGDAVEAAFQDDPGTFTLSLHMDTAYAYPGRGGRFEDQGTEAGGFTTLNLPLPPGTGDAAYLHVMRTAWNAVLVRFSPDCVVLQAGADAIAADPLGRLALTTQGFLQIVEHVIRESPRHADGTPRLMVTGGGGYHPLVVARAWTGIWGLLTGRDLPAALPPVARALLAAVEWDLDDDEDDRESRLASRLDPPGAGQVDAAARELAARVATHRGLATATA